ncbi:MAG: hypothetical protein IKP54_09745 [Bacteroidales bacterium]|nr:hypothetical protein [Bacteroidota bacterium]MBQ9509154.1 hypothetical protein [Bacteroidales bacterium]MBR6064421.1 hypothetical protein [Bacteroidales bacterium]
MAQLHSLTDYDTKLLLAFLEGLKGDKKFLDFLIANNFAELAALANAINSDTEALDWLLRKSNYPEFGVLSNAIDGEENAIEWLKKYQCDFLLKFALACRKDDEAIKWFAERDLKLFIMIIQRIHEILLFQSWDSSDVHRRRY